MMDNYLDYEYFFQNYALNLQKYLHMTLSFRKRFSKVSFNPFLYQLISKNE